MKVLCECKCIMLADKEADPSGQNHRKSNL